MRASLLATFLVSTLCATAACERSAPAGKPAPTVAPTSIQSDDILARQPVTDHAEVKHILISWKELAAAYGGHQDPRGAARTKAQADELALDLLKQVRAGADIVALMKQYSEDPGSAQGGTSYTATPDAHLVPPFKNLALRLKVGEAGLVQTVFGWHIIERVQ